MVEKVLEIVGVSPESFAKAVDDAVTETAKTVRNIRWVRVKELDCMVKGDRITEYHALVRIYFDVQR
jgi:flavin-binding protein dodecin